MSPKDTYFTAHFNELGELIGAERKGKKAKKQHIDDVSFKDNLEGVREVSVIMLEGHSPCCIKQGPYVFCWCH